MEIQVNLTEKQSKTFSFLTDEKTTEILYGGAAGGGKSFLGCAWLIINCIKYPDTRWLMGRSKLKALKQTTLNTFFEVTKMWKIKPEEHYHYNSQTGEIKFFNGSQIILKDLFLYPSDPNFDSLGSLEITGAFIDEANQVTEKSKNIVASRIRYKLDEYNLSPKLLMTCNPSKNWVYNEFYKKKQTETLEQYKEFIPALVTDNPNISKFYITQLEKLDEQSKRRLLRGEWEYEDKTAIIDYYKIIEIFKPDVEISEIEGDYYVSCDVARKGKDKAVILLWKGYTIIKSKIIDISLTNEIVAYITSLKESVNISNSQIVIDGDGVGGGVVDYLPNCYDFVNNSRAIGGENFQNLKTQCYFKLADIINNGELTILESSINLNLKENIIGELATIKRKNIDSDGKVQILSKEEVKALLGRSPDYSDAMMMRMVFSLVMPVSDWNLLF
jgi:hypothetical protein